ncbi:MerR family transcriptional regulator [Paenibacillus glycanilyticus]|uniref:MerR family transcriptional regulator n=1 Tax=Paenibacillus glycanilyticus TaxID=126569 RepID=UPI0020402FFC|nr:MerR family transcriptional regulator [Paenibacillus glycanilyticus]MCM3629341.1 MerR family transcriptional regulator [Paenibacillus glycanilyticus]
MDIPETASSIKQAAEFTGLSEDTIRYYEKIGLLPYADRKTSGHRTYSKHQLDGMVFLTRLKATGMTLEEMKRFRKLYERGEVTLPERVSLLIEHKNRIQNEIESLLETQRMIDYKIDTYKEVLVNPDSNKKWISSSAD